jgi:hypothetical protein
MLIGGKKKTRHDAFMQMLLNQVTKSILTCSVTPVNNAGAASPKKNMSPKKSTVLSPKKPANE